MAIDNISDELKIYELSLIWKEAEYNFAFWENLAGSLDWDKEYKTALSAVLKTKNLYEYYLELMKFLALLRDGHTGVWVPRAIENSAEYTAKLPIRTQLINGERIIINLKRCVIDTVKRWSVIKKVNGLDMEEYAEKYIYPYIWHEKKDSADFSINNLLSCGAVGSVVELELEYDGKIEIVNLTRTKGDVDWVYDETELKIAENLQQIYKSDSHSIFVTNDNIAIITIPTMGNNNLPKEFYANIPLLEKMKGFIIDIRWNGGGNSGNSTEVAKAFIKHDFESCRALMPMYIGTYKAWKGWEKFGDMTYDEVVAKTIAEHGELEPEQLQWIERSYKITRHTYYEESTHFVKRDNCPTLLEQPLIVLSSCHTGSAAENFLVELDYNKRAIIVGSASNGSTGQPLSINLESGGGFRVCTRNCTYPDGRKFINIGVQPHIPHEITLDDYKNNVDSVMIKGLEEIRKMI